MLDYEQALVVGPSLPSDSDLDQLKSELTSEQKLDLWRRYEQLFRDLPIICKDESKERKKLDLVDSRELRDPIRGYENAERVRRLRGEARDSFSKAMDEFTDTIHLLKRFANLLSIPVEQVDAQINTIMDEDSPEENLD